MLNRRIPAGQWVAISIVATILLFTVVTRTILRHGPPPAPSPAPSIVGVQGDVVQPGIYLLTGSAPTVDDAVRAAGGILAGGRIDARQVSGVRTLRSGDQIRVRLEAAGQIEFVFERMDGAARLTMGMKLDLNQVTEGDLSLVPMMKREMAAAIVARRHGKPWEALDELLEIPGVGAKTIEKWRAYLEVNR